MSILDAWLKLKVEKAIDEAVRLRAPDIAKEIVDDLWKTNPKFRFIKWVQAELLRVDPSLSAKDSFNRAKGCIEQSLEDERVEFGHPDFAWDRDAAVDIAHAYEVDHWECRA